MKHLFMVLWLVIVISPMSLATAQQECSNSDPAHVAWLEVAFSVVVDYPIALENGGDVQRVGALQELRRRIEQIEHPECDDAAFQHLLNALNWAADAIVLDLIRDTTGLASNLRLEAEAEFVAAAALITTPEEPSGGDQAALPRIVAPPDGGFIDRFDIVVRGTHDSTQYDAGTAEQLWVFVIPPNQQYYPQTVNDGCDPTRRASVAYRPGSWTVTAFAGTLTEGIGDLFEIMLAVGDAAATQSLWDRFDNEWCPTGRYPGLTSSEVFNEMGFVPVQSSFVTRTA